MLGFRHPDIENDLRRNLVTTKPAFTIPYYEYFENAVFHAWLQVGKDLSDGQFRLQSYDASL